MMFFMKNTVAPESELSSVFNLLRSVFLQPVTSTASTSSATTGEDVFEWTVILKHNLP